LKRAGTDATLVKIADGGHGIFGEITAGCKPDVAGAKSMKNVNSHVVNSFVPVLSWLPPDAYGSSPRTIPPVNHRPKGFVPCLTEKRSPVGTPCRWRNIFIKPLPE
jgi:hypothetical protein